MVDLQEVNKPSNFEKIGEPYPNVKIMQCGVKLRTRDCPKKATDQKEQKISFQPLDSEKVTDYLIEEGNIEKSRGNKIKYGFSNELFNNTYD